MRVTVRVAVFVAACAFVTPLDATAQERGGFWFGISVGPGSAGVQCTDCFFNDRRTAGTGVLKGGWTLNPRMLVGVEVDLWLQESRAIEDPFTVSLTLSNFSGTFTYYPSASSGFYFKGGAGVAMADLDGRAEVTPSRSTWARAPAFLPARGTTFPCGGEFR